MTSDQRLLARQRRSSGAMNDFDGDRLALARRLRRLPRTALASLTSVTPAALTQFEKNDSRPTLVTASQLALALGVSVDFFRRGRPIETLKPGGAHFRSLRSTPAISRDQALAFAELSLATVDLLEQYVDFPTLNLPVHPAEESAAPQEVAEAAQVTRREFGITTGPIAHMVRLLESRGVIVLRMPAGMDSKVDAFSTSLTGRALVMLSDVKDDRARSRFDAAHELGHLVMHPDIEPGSKIIESQAHQFAAEFLAPTAELLPDLPRRIDWEVLHRLKARWGLSLRALAFRAHSLEVWGDATYRRSMQMLSEFGLPEPGPLGPAESPSLLGAAAQLIESSGTSIGEFAASGRLPESEVRQVINAGREQRLKLSVVPDARVP